MTPPPSFISLSVSATHRLPRWILLAICILYGLAGLFGRDPWKHNDATGFGVMWSMAKGGMHDWLLPNIAGRTFDHDGPLMFWLGAAMIRLFGNVLEIPDAARLATALCFFLSCALLWRCAYLLGKRPEVQPFAFAFGGQPQAKDYGRALADGALLIFLACVGLAQQAHETTAGLAQLTLITFLLYGLVWRLERCTQGALLIGLALGGLVLASGLVLPSTLFLMIALTTYLYHGLSGRYFQILLLLTLPLAILVAAVWPLLLSLFVDHQLAWLHLHAWFEQDFQRFNGPSQTALGYTLRNLLPYAWPVWPLAIWAWISWRKAGKIPQVALPLGVIASILVLIFFQHTGDDILFMLLVPPLALLATFALPTLKRSVGNAIDWFALMASTVLGGFIWLVWNAKITGFPAQTARNLYRLLPGLKAEFSWMELCAALAVSLAWLAIVRWRLGRAPKMIWRSVVISAAGTTLIWVLMMTLWLPTINYAKTYRQVALAAAAVMPTHYLCVRPVQMSDPQLASFAYFTQLRFSESRTDCDFLLRHDSQNTGMPISISRVHWRLIWEGRRPADRDERFRLYERRKSSRVLESVKK